MKFIRILLVPFTPFYYAITWLRNFLYDTGILSATRYPFPVICVGNLSVGGTGKSPMVMHLITLLKDTYQVATLSRGYKRTSKGFQLANKTSSVTTIGDEPFMFFEAFSNEIYVAVDINRQEGIAKLQEIKPPPEIILLDDAFQHRKVQAGLNILLTTYSNLYSNDWVLPTGNLREPKSGAKRAHIIVVTKCPENLTEAEKITIKNKLQPTAEQHLFFSTICYVNYVVSEKLKVSLQELDTFTLVTGIANATPLVTFLKSKKLSFEHLNFKDHHSFTAKEIAILETKKTIVTTQKDYVRLKKYPALQEKLWYVPITIDISEKFNRVVLNFVSRQ